MVRITRRHIVLAAIALLAHTPAAFAQAAITGAVTDTTGAVVPGVTVEASSPALIEGTRVATTDGHGRFQIVDLRPGQYVVVFTLDGFRSVRRDAVTLTGSATTSVDAQMHLGALEEVVTVTAAPPAVDLTKTTRQYVIAADVLDALPTARNYSTVARLVPGTVGGGNDVGGSLLPDVGAALTVHGSHANDQRITLNGISVMTLQAGGALGGQQPDMGSAAEVTIDTTSLSADLPTGGVRINFIPRDGGNEYQGSTVLTFASRRLQGDNFSAALRNAGLPTPNRIVRNWDVNASAGGPVARSKVWFWLSSRLSRVENETSVFANRNAFAPDKWTYEADPARPGVNKGELWQASMRMTWQATPRHKIAGTYKADAFCQCPYNVGATSTGLLSPEAAHDRRFPRLQQEHLEWTAAVNDHLLLEAVGMHLYERWGNMHLRAGGGSLQDDQEAVLPQMIAVLEQSRSMIYRANPQYNSTRVANFAYRAAASHVTGSRTLKIGVNQSHGFLDEEVYTLNPVSYRFNTVDGVTTPNQITQWATPLRSVSNLDRDFGAYAQGQWTLRHLVVTGAARFDSFAVSFPAQIVGPTPLTPARHIEFPAQSAVAWNDLSYRTGAVYDVGGAGRTAIKLSANKYLLGQALNGLARDPNPALSLSNTATRTWNDADRDFTPDCNLLDPNANGECLAITPRSFGSVVPSGVFDEDLLTGWGHRPANWEFSAAVQHALLPRVSIDVSYIRRTWQNFSVVDNLLVEPGDFTPFSMTAPVDARLPGGGGYAVDGLVNVVPDKFGQVLNYHTLSEKYGRQIDHWDGVDITMAARLRHATIQGGFSSGRRIEDNCDVVAKLPEVQLSAGTWWPAQYCRREEPLQTQVKLFGVSTLPRVGVQIAATVRSTPGATINANFTANGAYLAANSTLQRPLSGGGSMTIALLQPGSRHLARRTEVDLRLGRVFHHGSRRILLNVDLYNLTNAAPVLTAIQAFASWLRPTTVLNARVAKLGLQFEF